jgi:tetratricopeptide (TPR) repeat protein
MTMKRILGLILLLFLAGSMPAQVSILTDIEKNLKKGDLHNAAKLTDKSIQDGQLATMAQTWYLRGMVYQKIYESSDNKVNDLPEYPLFVCADAYYKSLILDNNKQYYSLVIHNLATVSQEMVFEGVAYFNNTDYTNALKAFEHSIKINRMPEFNQLDTIVMFNAALSAEKLNNYEQAADLFSQLVKMNYGEGETYLRLATCFRKSQRYPEYLQTLKLGMKYFSVDRLPFISEFVNYYLEKENADSVIFWTHEAIQLDSLSADYHYILGSAFDQQNNLINAEKEYLTAIRLKKDFGDAKYNLAVIYYNKATDILRNASYKSQQNESLRYFNNALPYLEDVLAENHTDEHVYQMLKTIYTVLKMDEKLVNLENIRKSGN